MKKDSNNQEQEDNNEDLDIIKREQPIKWHWYIIGFVTVYFISWVIPGILFFLYIFLFFVPYFLDTSNFILIFTELEPLLSLLFFPIVLILCAFLHIFFAAAVTKFWYGFTQKISPAKDGVIPRNIPSKTASLYHIRSFLLKYPKNTIMKGMFPWLFTWMFNFIGSTDYGKGTTVEEEVCGDRFAITGKNCYVGPNASLASHLVEGIFGNIYYFKVKLGDNCTVGAESPLAPGTELGDNSYVFPGSATLKFTVAKGGYYYFGMPIRKLFSRKLKKFLDLTDEDLERAEKLEEKQTQKKEKAD
ncbi:MAG: hypothetical protein ACQERB_06405 [Promethearchaeati archaeon]